MSASNDSFKPSSGKRKSGAASPDTIGSNHTISHYATGFHEIPGGIWDNGIFYPDAPEAPEWAKHPTRRKQQLVAQEGEQTQEPPPLVSILQSMPSPFFAVIDGAHFEDLPQTLTIAGLPHNSLFRGEADKELEKAGPWFVPVSDENAETLRELLTDTPAAAVFWHCPLGEAALYRHLRTINQALVPLPVKENVTYTTSADPADYKETLVLFRHYDPNVMASTLPLLAYEQVYRILGSNRELMFYAPDHGGLLAARSPLMQEDDEVLTKGFLRLTIEQMKNIEQLRILAQKKKIMSYLKDTAPENYKKFSTESINKLIIDSMTTVKSLKMHKESSLMKFSYLSMISNGKFINVPGVKEYLSSNILTPDKRMDLMMKSIIEALRQKAKL